MQGHQPATLGHWGAGEGAATAKAALQWNWLERCLRTRRRPLKIRRGVVGSPAHVKTRMLILMGHRVIPLTTPASGTIIEQLGYKQN